MIDSPERKQDKRTKINKQERKKADSMQGEYAYLQARKQRGGGVAPGQNTRKTSFATKESRESKRKAEKAIPETNGKRQNEKQNETEKRKEERQREIQHNDTCVQYVVVSSLHVLQ